MKLINPFKKSNWELVRLEETDRTRIQMRPDYGSGYYDEYQIWKKTWRLKGTNVEFSKFIS